MGDDPPATPPRREDRPRPRRFPERAGFDGRDPNGPVDSQVDSPKVLGTNESGRAASIRTPHDTWGRGSGHERHVASKLVC